MQERHDICQKNGENGKASMLKNAQIKMDKLNKLKLNIKQ